MPLTLGTDTFTTLAQASAYLSRRLHAVAWATADEAAREGALVMATAMLNRERYRGRITDAAQRLAWPRTGLSDREGRPIAADAVPAEIAQATAELALVLIATDLTDDRVRLHREHLRSEGIGASQATYTARVPSALPSVVRELISPFLRVASTSAAELVP
jgi:hypothetical protein